MDRRTLLIGAVAAWAGWRPGVASAQSAAKTVLRLGLANGRNSQTGQGAAAFARDVTRRSDGRIRIELYPFSAAGGEVELAQDMVAGAIDMAFISSAGYANAALVPALGLFDIPFLFRDVAHARAVLDGGIGTAALARVEKVGLVGLAWGESGLRHMTTASVPVRSPKDLAGLKIRVPQSDVMMAGFRALGAEPTPMPFPDLYEALASGTVQGQENPLGNIKDASFDQVQKYLSLTGHVYSAAMLMMPRPVFDALKREDQDLLRSAAREATRASREASDRNQQGDVDELRRRGMTVVDDVDRPSFVAAMASANPAFEQTFGRAELDAIRSFRS